MDTCDRACRSASEVDSQQAPVERRRIIPGLARLPRRAGATETMGCHAPHGRARSLHFRASVAVGWTGLGLFHRVPNSPFVYGVEIA